ENKKNGMANAYQNHYICKIINLKTLLPMKKTLLLWAMAFFVLQFSNAQDDAAKVQELLTGAINFNDTDLSGETPIQSVNRIASQQADTSLVLSKENIESVLSTSKEYSKG